MLTAILDELAAVSQRRQEAGDDARLIADARQRALALAGSGNDLGAVAAFIAELLTSMLFDRVLDHAEVDDLLRRAAAALDAEHNEVAMWTFVQAVRDPRMLSLSPRVAAEAQIRLLVLLAGISSASLWGRTAHGEPVRILLRAGATAETRTTRQAAEAAIETGALVGGERTLVRALPVLRWQQPVAAVVIRLSTAADQPTVLARECALALAPVLEREVLLGQSTGRARLLADAGEARLRTIGLDLHDGALQEVARLRGDLQLFRHQLAEALAPGRVTELLLGRVDDVTAQLVSIDNELRSLAASTHSPALLRKPFGEILTEEIAAHRARSDLHTRLDVSGDLDELGQAQRIAIFRIIQEALANVRAHSDASEVVVSVRARRGQVRAEIVDDGVGFDVQRTLAGAVRRGRLGLVGMSERAALLGGALQIDSRPGGPTRLAVVLPVWRAVLDASGEAAGADEPAAAPRQA